MIEKLDKLPVTDLFSRSEENVPGICSPNQPKYLDEKSVLPLANAELCGEGDMTSSGQNTVKYGHAPDLRCFGDFTQFKLDQVNCDHTYLYSSRQQPVGLEKSQRKSDWVRADFEDFEGQ